MTKRPAGAVLGNDRYRHAARQMAERMAATRGPQRLAEIVDSLITARRP